MSLGNSSGEWTSSSYTVAGSYNYSGSTSNPSQERTIYTAGSTSGSEYRISQELPIYTAGLPGSIYYKLEPYLSIPIVCDPKKIIPRKPLRMIRIEDRKS